MSWGKTAIPGFQHVLAMPAGKKECHHTGRVGWLRAAVRPQKSAFHKRYVGERCVPEPLVTYDLTKDHLQTSVHRRSAVCSKGPEICVGLQELGLGRQAQRSCARG